MAFSSTKVISVRTTRKRQAIGFTSADDCLLPVVPSLAGYVVKALSPEEVLRVLNSIKAHPPKAE
jgi:hypothetical protein